MVPMNFMTLRLIIGSLMPTFHDMMVWDEHYSEDYCELLEKVRGWTNDPDVTFEQCIDMLRIRMYLKARVGGEYDACVDIASTVESLSGGTIKFKY